MKFDRLLGGVEVVDVRGDPSAAEITAVVHDSRMVVPGALFCCLPGARADGHDFAPAAVSAGAAALLCERPVAVDVPQAVVADARVAMAPVAAAFYDDPSRALSVVGVTGTNGKTTTVQLLQAVLEHAGRRCAAMGTLTGTRTTPESPVLQAELARWRDGGGDAVAMEVSSHALSLHRVDATWFAAAVFTNLSPEHLDFHETMEDYFRAKASLFDPDRAAVAVVNADDPYGRLLVDAARLPTRAFSMADAAGVDVGAGGSTFRWRDHDVHLALAGRFNVANALAAATTAEALGVDARTIADGLSSVRSVPGRFETVDAGQPFAVIVDYAHTPAALEHVLAAARELAGDGGRVFVVFGAGGDRDQSKRPAMGEAAARLADVAVLTTDNPRHEDPLRIIDDVKSGVERTDRLRIEPDRAAAIAHAVTAARPGDVVVVAGKGHETGQVVGDEILPFDDRSVVADALAQR